MTTVWLLFNEMDYESATVHSVYNEKPNPYKLAMLIRDSFGYAYDPQAAHKRAVELFETNRVRMLDNYTWELEERYVV